MAPATGADGIPLRAVDSLEGGFDAEAVAVNVITHLLVGWTLADASKLGDRDRALVAWAGVLPDVDGLGAVVNVGNRLLRRPDSHLYADWHHRLLHGLPGAVLTDIAVAFVARSRVRAALGAFGLVHVHIVSDLVGSRGPSPADIWPVYYLAPLSDWPTISWSGQWPLNAWPNVVLTLLLVAYAFVTAVRRGTSPVMLFSPGANEAFVSTVRGRLSRWRARSEGA